MKKLGMFLVALFIVGSAQAQMEYPLVSISDVTVSNGEVRCGDFFIFTKSTPQGPSIMFRISLGGHTGLRVVELSHVTLASNETVRAPTVVITSSGNTISAVQFKMVDAEVQKVKPCFPPPATVLLSPK